MRHFILYQCLLFGNSVLNPWIAFSGFKLNCQLHQVIVARFADEELVIDFDNFVRCLIRLETLFKMFRKLDTEKSGTIELNLVNWLCFTVIWGTGISLRPQQEHDQVKIIKLHTSNILTWMCLNLHIADFAIACKKKSILLQQMNLQPHFYVWQSVPTVI